MQTLEAWHLAEQLCVCVCVYEPMAHLLVCVYVRV